MPLEARRAKHILRDLPDRGAITVVISPLHKLQSRAFAVGDNTEGTAAHQLVEGGSVPDALP